MKTKIPKIIHWCWVGPDSPPPLIKKCIKSWKKNMPDYEIKLWDRNSFDMNSVPFVKEAFENKKWAFVADYIRLFALYNYGGIYLDSDVMIYKSLSPFLKYDFFTGQDICSPNKVIGPEAAIIGSVPKLKYIGDLLNYYNKLKFINEDGSFNQIVMPINMGKLLEPYGYLYKDETHRLPSNFIILSSEYFSNWISSQYRPINYAQHYNTNYWNKSDEGYFYRLCYNNGWLFFYDLPKKINYHINKIRNNLKKTK